eukprot:3714557-Pyramimonas_sp.AAC.1
MYRNIRITSRNRAPGEAQSIGVYVKHMGLEPLLLPFEASCSWGLSGPPVALTRPRGASCGLLGPPVAS